MSSVVGRIARAVDGLRSRAGDAEARFRCCDTTFVASATGPGARQAVSRARETARRLEAVLNAFDPDSAVSELAETGRVTNTRVATLVRRGLTYAERTDGAFDIRRGRLERDLKAYVREGGEHPTAPDSSSPSTASVSVDGTTVRTDAPLDLNGLAKGYIVDQAAAVLQGPGRTGFVSGGGDIAHPTGPVGIEDPYGDTPATGPAAGNATPDHLLVLDTDWHVATSAGYRRQRGDVDHVYDPRTGDAGSRHDLVTVVAARDCTEADAAATALAASSLDDALALANDWDGLEALVVHSGVVHRSEGFDAHVAD